jgi:hypothetical protein
MPVLLGGHLVFCASVVRTFARHIIFASMLSRDWFPRQAIFLTNPFTQIDQLATLRTKRAKGIVLPLDLPIAIWTLHESGMGA